MQISSDSCTFYQRIGGETPLKALVHAFYAHMDRLPETATIRQMHVDLADSEAKLFMFLSGWMGGPPLYVEKYGHPRLRMRHLPFSIGESERDQWLLCMQCALDDCVEDATLRTELMQAFHDIADFMRNRS